MKRRDFLGAVTGLVAGAPAVTQAATVKPRLVLPKEPDTGYGWDIITLVGEFTSSRRAGQRRAFTAIVDRDVWARKLVYEVVTIKPNGYSRTRKLSIRPDQNPHIDFLLTFRRPGFKLWDAIPTFCPLEQAELAFDCIAPQGLVLPKGSVISGWFLNRSELQGDVTVKLRLHGLVLTRGAP